MRLCFCRFFVELVSAEITQNRFLLKFVLKNCISMVNRNLPCVIAGKTVLLVIEIEAGILEKGFAEDRKRR